MSLFRVTLLRFMTFRTPTLSHDPPRHAPPTISCIKSSFMATPEEVAPAQRRRVTPFATTPPLLTLATLQFSNFLRWRILDFDNLLQVIDKHNAR